MYTKSTNHTIILFLITDRLVKMMLWPLFGVFFGCFRCFSQLQVLLLEASMFAPTQQQHQDWQWVTTFVLLVRSSIAEERGISVTPLVWSTAICRSASIIKHRTSINFQQFNGCFKWSCDQNQNQVEKSLDRIQYALMRSYDGPTVIINTCMFLMI